MPIDGTELESLIAARFPDGEVKVTDLAGDNDHWSVEVVSAEFSGKSRIEQHRMVQDAVKDKDIHALAIKTMAKEA